MKKISLPKKRGRPVDVNKHEQILDAASTLFMDKGFHATSMDEIAKALAISKLTLYRRFPDKETLFLAVIERKCQQFLPDQLFADINNQSPETILYNFSQAFFALLMSDDAIKLYRMIITEAVQHTEMAELFYKAGPKRLQDITDSMLIQLQRQGLLKSANLQVMREWLLSLFTGSDLYMKALLNLGQKASSNEIDAYAKRVSELFSKAFF